VHILGGPRANPTEPKLLNRRADCEAAGSTCLPFARTRGQPTLTGCSSALVALNRAESCVVVDRELAEAAQRFVCLCFCMQFALLMTRTDLCCAALETLQEDDRRLEIKVTDLGSLDFIFISLERACGGGSP
jgi:hypothetical protein